MAKSKHGGGRTSSKRHEEQFAPDSASDPLVGTRMRVWWPPTDEPKKTGFAGAYWPAKVIGKRIDGTYHVEYDNGDTENVITENLAPDDPPVGFGQESTALQPGEFCEVSNNSNTDPCAWVGMVARHLSSGKYLVKYPFHDSPSEEIPPHLIRRARVLDMDGWCLLKPHQKWRDGDVTSPHELESVKEEALAEYVDLSAAKPAPTGHSKAVPKQAGGAGAALNQKRLTDNALVVAAGAGNGVDAQAKKKLRAA